MPFILMLPSIPKRERQCDQQQDYSERSPENLPGGLRITGFRWPDLGFRLGVWRDSGALSGGFQIVGNRLILIQPYMAGIGSHKAFVENTARQLVEVFVLQGLQHAGANLGGEGNLIQRDGTLFAFELQSLTKGRQAILPSGPDGDGILHVKTAS